MERYREERNSAVRRKNNIICLQTIQSKRLVVHFEHGISMTGLCMTTSIKESLKERPG